MMSLASTKNELVSVINAQSNKVIALSGEWGTGKSYMWDQIQREKSLNGIDAPLYVSLFGLKSLDEVKVRLINSASPLANFENSRKSIFNVGRGVASSTVKILESFHKGFGAIRDLGLIAAPLVLKNRFIVVDDIERKHAHLSIDEVLGFIDEFTKQYQARFLLILNSDQLEDCAVWSVLREKVIDYEIKLNTTADEAFGIASDLVPSPNIDNIRSAIRECGVNNIRVICKVIRAVDRILGGRMDLPKSVLERTIPSATLLACIFYKGMKNPPGLDFVLNFNEIIEPVSNPNAEIDGDAVKLEAKWRATLSRLGLVYSDDFERKVVDFLENGQSEGGDLSCIIDRYISEERLADLELEVRSFFDRARWDVKSPVEDIIADATSILDRVHLLDGFRFTSFFEKLSGMHGGKQVADEALALWIKGFEASPPNGIVAVRDFHGERKLHSSIEALFVKHNSSHKVLPSIIDVCNAVNDNSGWSHDHVMAVQSLSSQDFELFIRGAGMHDLRIVMLTILEWEQEAGSYRRHFGRGIDSFIEACRIISKDTSNERLAELVKIIFSEMELLHRLSD